MSAAFQFNLPRVKAARHLKRHSKKGQQRQEQEQSQDEAGQGLGAEIKVQNAIYECTSVQALVRASVCLLLYGCCGCRIDLSQNLCHNECPCSSRQ